MRRVVLEIDEDVIRDFRVRCMTRAVSGSGDILAAAWAKVLDALDEADPEDDAPVVPLRLRRPVD